MHLPWAPGSRGDSQCISNPGVRRNEQRSRRRHRRSRAQDQADRSAIFAPLAHARTHVRHGRDRRAHGRAWHDAHRRLRAYHGGAMERANERDLRVQLAFLSTQTYKHLNAGEGGFLTSDNPAFMARAIIMSGSYMLYERHLAAPDPKFFTDVRFDTPNFSGRMDNLRAAILRPPAHTTGFEHRALEPTVLDDSAAVELLKRYPHA